MWTATGPRGAAPPAALPDQEVVRRVLAGDGASFEILMRRHNQGVYRAIRAILRRDEAEIEDAMQQTYLQAYDGLRSFEGASSFATWLTRIALHVALGRVRRLTRHAALEAIAASEESSSASRTDPEDRAARRESMELLERAIDRLPEGYRIVFMLREVDGRSTAETATVLAISEENVKVRLHRARLALRDLVAEEVGESAPQAFAFLAPRCDRVAAAVLGAIAAR